MRISLIDYKSQIRNSISSIFIFEFETMRRLGPILIGIYKVLYFQYPGDSILSTHEKIFLNCFQTNLPGIGPQHKKIGRQTFDQIFLNELKTENQESSQILMNQNSKIFQTRNVSKNFNTKKIDFYKNSIIISPSSNWNRKQKKLYLGLFNTKMQFISVDQLNKNEQNYQLGNNWLNISAKKPYNYLSYFKSAYILDQIKTKKELINRHTNMSNTIYSDLDELPLKLNSSYSLNFKVNSNSSSCLEPLSNDFLKNKVRQLCLSKSRAAPLAQVVPTSEPQNLSNKNLSHKEINTTLKFSDGAVPTSDQTKNSLKSFKLKSWFSKPTPKFWSKISKPRSFKSKKIRNAGYFFAKNKIQSTFFTKSDIINLQGITLKKNSNNENILLTSCNDNKKQHFLIDKKNKNILGQAEQSKSRASEAAQVIPTSGQYFDQFIKRYSSKKNLLFLPNYEVLDTFFQDIVNTKNKTFLGQLEQPGKKSSSKETSRLQQNFFLSGEHLQTNQVSQLTSSKESLKLLKILEKFISIDKNIDIAPRLMSGYIFPDSNTESTFLHLKKDDNSCTLEIPKNFFNYQTGIKLDFSPDNIYFNLISEKSKLSSKQRTLYNGPLIFENKNTNELQITNPEKVNELYRQLISSDNPLTDQQQNFFGNYFLKTNSIFQEFNSDFDPKIAIKKPLFTKKKYIRKFTTGLVPKHKMRQFAPKIKFFRKEMMVPNPNKLLSTKHFRYLGYLNQWEWNKFAETLKTNDKLKNDKVFPIKSTYQTTDKIVYWPLNQVDFTSNKDKTAGIFQDRSIDSKKISFFSTQHPSDLSLVQKTFSKQFQPSIGMPLSKKKTVRSHKYTVGNIYKKTNTVYTNKNNNGNFLKKNLGKQTEFLKSSFYQSLEPMTYSSFLTMYHRYSLFLSFIHIFNYILKKYQQEIKSFLLAFMDQKNSSNENEIDNFQQNFRIVKNIKKNFDNIGGIDAILPELGEIVWFLRSSSESLPFYQKKIQNTISQATLLTGPPGTGKTLLVQAIAGEAEVPVLIESASSLMQPSKFLNGPERVKNLFQKAREIAPCIVFIDEIDTFGERRSVMMENPIFHDPILDSIYPNSQKHKSNSTLLSSLTERKNKIPDYTSILNSQEQRQNIFNDSENDIVSDQNDSSLKDSLKQHKTHLLMQLLIELDGVASDKKVLVFAATNRPQILDSALTRPGRFNKTLDLKLPNKQKRIEIIKLYSENLGVEKNISLDYIANLTIGLSAADLASAINQSSIQAIQGETIHTIETLEYGIHSITGYITQKNKLKSFVKQQLLTKTTNSFLINRLAYYQAGKIVVHTLLETHPNIISVHLWPEVKNPRQHLIHSIREKQFSQIYRRIELESRIVGFYAGKAGELIGLFQEIFSNKNKQRKTQNNIGSMVQKMWPKEASRPSLGSQRLGQVKQLKSRESEAVLKKTKSFSLVPTFEPSLAVLQSDLGIQDMNLASWLGEMMINKWYLYSKKISLQNFNRLKENYNTEHNTDSAIVDFLRKESSIFHSLYQNLQNNSKQVTSPNVSSVSKNSHLWLQKRIAKKFEFLYSTKRDWSRIYSADHKRDENTRYVAPDIYYHSNIYLKKLNKYKFINTKILVKNKFSSIVNWNEIYPVNRDYIYHSLLGTCFNKALSIIDQNRELLDLFATLLLQKEILREYEIYDIIQEFFTNRIDQSLDSELSLASVQSKNIDFSKSAENNQNKIYNQILQQTNKTKSKNNKIENKFFSYQADESFENDKKFQEIQSTWGEKSRRKLCKFINFRNLKNSIKN